MKDKAKQKKLLKQVIEADKKDRLYDDPDEIRKVIYDILYNEDIDSITQLKTIKSILALNLRNITNKHQDHESKRTYQSIKKI